ncbi:MAG TPA: mechanosensitive ion channel domain-containing protein [Cellulomonas sp.]
MIAAHLTAMLPGSILPTDASPSPSTSTEPDLGTATVESANALVQWLLGPGLRIAVIAVLAAVTLLLVRRLIKAVTEHIAEGSSLLQRGIARPLGGPEVAAALRRANPIASARRTQRARTIGSVLRSAAAILIGSVAVLLMLDQIGVNIAPFIASAGVVGVAVGFGAQSLVKDFLSGLFMLLEDQYGVGDVVDVGPAQGTVEEVALRVTKIRDTDGTLWYVSNGSMTRVGNKTQGWANAVVEVKVDYFADLGQVRDLLTAAITGLTTDPDVGDDLEGSPTVTTAEDLSFDAVTVRVTQRTTPARQWAVARAMRRAARLALEQADIPLAGQRDLLTAHRERSASQQDDAERDGTERDGTAQGEAPEGRSGRGTARSAEGTSQPTGSPAQDGTRASGDEGDGPADRS